MKTVFFQENVLYNTFCTEEKRVKVNMVFFAYPLWNRLQAHRSIRLALDGIFAAAVGFILTAAMLINYYFWNQFTHFNQHVGLQIGIFIFTLLLLYTKKVPTPFIVLLMILMGWLIPM